MVGAVVALALAAVLTVGHGAKARTPQPQQVGGIGGVLFSLNADGSLAVTQLSPLDDVPACTTAGTGTVTTEDPDDPADGGQFSVFLAQTDNAAAAGTTMAVNNRIDWTTLYIYWTANGNLVISYEYTDPNGVQHLVGITVFQIGGISITDTPL